MSKFLYFFIVILRILSAPLIFIWPLISIILSFFLDIIDVEFASKGVLTLEKYERYDKALDLWWYITIMAFSWFYLSDYKIILLILFALRIIGSIIFFINNNRKIFFIFPNFFENVFFLIFFSTYFKQLNILLGEKFFYFSIITVITLKIFQEWWIHIAQISIPECFFGKKRNWKK
ncbi:MAG: hypothetical protein WC894_01405 [Patescibacteria group bacterium]